MCAKEWLETVLSLSNTKSNSSQIFLICLNPEFLLLSVFGAIFGWFFDLWFYCVLARIVLEILVLGHVRSNLGHGLNQSAHEHGLISVFPEISPFAWVSRIPEIDAYILNFLGPFGWNRLPMTRSFCSSIFMSVGVDLVEIYVILVEPKLLFLCSLSWTEQNFEQFGDDSCSFDMVIFSSTTSLFCFYLAV